MIKKHFTLIELLVVVAIIGILSSLLLPSLGKARGKAQMYICLNNQRQVSLSISLYADDNDGSAYLAMNTVQNEIDDAGIVNRDAGLWECPEDKGTWSYGNLRPIDVGFSTTFKAQKNSYLMNERYTAAKKYEADGVTENNRSKTNIKNINQIIEPDFFLWVGCAPLRGDWGGHDAFANLWHNGETKWPISFPDGHAVIMSDSRAPVTSMYGGRIENDWFGVVQHEGWYKDKLGL